MKPRVIDLSLFFNEFDLLQLRLKTLYDVVDYFVVVESTQTFSGKDKPLLLGKNLQRYTQYFDKFRYYPLTPQDYRSFASKTYSQYRTPLYLRLAHKHQGRAPRWLHRSCKREIRQRDSAVLALLNFAHADDLILLSDADEIASPSSISKLLANRNNGPQYLSMNWYLYYLDNKVHAPWIGTVAFQFKQLYNHSLDQLRFGSSDAENAPGEIIPSAGWHFSYLGGDKMIIEKLNAITYQGMKGTLLILLARIWPQFLSRTLRLNRDLLFQGRQFKRVLIDDSYPKPLLDDPDLIARYSAPPSANEMARGDNSPV